MRAHRMNRRRQSRSAFSSSVALCLAVIFLATITSTTASAEGFAGSKLEDGLASATDVAFVRPLATLRVLIGGILFVPAAALSAAGGKESFEGAYDLFLGAPIEFAFDRKLGEF